MNDAGAASYLSSAQRSNSIDPQTNDEGSAVQDVVRQTEAISKDSGRIAAVHDGPPAARKDSTPGSPLPLRDPGIPQVIPAHVGTTSLEARILGSKEGPLKQDEQPVEHSTPVQPTRPLPSLEDHEILGVNREQAFSQRGQSGHEGSGQFSEQWSGDNRPQAGNAEPMIQPSFLIDHPMVNGSVAASVAFGASSQTLSVPGTPPPTSFVTHVQPGVHAEDMAQSAGVPVMRSVVVNVTQPDLGQVNIRVAMTNELVHTHFSSDRLEVGQFLINGQDRLQTALQASGLDMGQFRVDIDRQNGGRSFQQGPFQEHGQSWSQNSHGMGQEPHSDQPDQTRGTLPGLLNLVA